MIDNRKQFAGNGKLTEFGQNRVCEFARNKAESIDAETSVWWHRASLLFSLLAIGGALQAIGNLLAVGYYMLFGNEFPTEFALGLLIGVIVMAASMWAFEYAVERSGFE